MVGQAAGIRLQSRSTLLLPDVIFAPIFYKKLRKVLAV